jgi:hypothetical protein
VSPEAASSSLESARAASDAAKSALSEARATLASETSALASLRAESFDGLAAFSKAAAKARASVQSAEDAVRFHEARAAAAEAALEPLSRAQLHRDLSDAVAARSLALAALRAVAESVAQLAEPIRESVALARQAQLDIDAACAALSAKGESHARPADDDLGVEVAVRVPKTLALPSDAVSAALQIVKHEETKPQRDAERERVAKEAADDNARRYREACLRREHGEEAYELAREEERKAILSFYKPPPPMQEGMRGTYAAIVTNVERNNAGMGDMRE